MNAPLHRALASSVETDELQASLAAGRAISAAMDDAFVKVAMLWLAASVRDFLWAIERGHDTAPQVASMRASYARSEEALKAAEDRGRQPKRTVADAVNDAREIIHDRRAQAFRDSRLLYPKDEQEITRG